MSTGSCSGAVATSHGISTCISVQLGLSCLRDAGRHGRAWTWVPLTPSPSRLTLQVSRATIILSLAIYLGRSRLRFFVHSFGCACECPARRMGCSYTFFPFGSSMFQKNNRLLRHVFLHKLMQGMGGRGTGARRGAMKPWSQETTSQEAGEPKRQGARKAGRQGQTKTGRQGHRKTGGPRYADAAGQQSASSGGQGDRETGRL